MQKDVNFPNIFEFRACTEALKYFVYISDYDAQIWLITSVLYAVPISVGLYNKLAPLPM